MTSKENLLNDNIKSIFFKFLIPSVGGMLGTSLYVLGDTMIVGRYLGNDGLVALNLSIPIINVFTGLGLLFGIGGATLYSIDKGRGINNKLNKYFTLSVIYSLIIGLILTLIRVFFIDELVSFFGAKDNIFLMSKDYLKTLMLFSIPFVLNITLQVFVRNDGSPKIAMTSMLVGSILNVILDYIFIKIFNMGMLGGALATGIAPLVGLLILSTHFIKKKNNVKLTKDIKGENISLDIIKTGFPSFIIELSSGIVIFAFNAVILNISGNISVSAYTVIANLSLIVVAIFQGVAQAVQPIVSINYGANKKTRYIKTVKYGIYTSFILGLIFYLTGLIFPKFLVSLFSHEKGEFLKITKNGIKLYFTAFLVMGINIVITSYMQSINDERRALFISLKRGLILNIIILLIMSSLFKLNGVWLTLFIVEVLTLIISLIFFNNYKEALFSSFKFERT